MDPNGFSAVLSDIVEELGLMRVAGGHLDLSAVTVTTSEVNRPGLQLTGYTQHFAPDRLQIIGWTETAYLADLNPVTREFRLDKYFSLGFPALIVTRGLHVMPDMVQAADRHDIPVMVTDMLTSDFAGALNRLLAHKLAPRQRVEAGFVDVYGEGVLILGESGMTQSETALELVRRGHRLIASGEVEVRRISDRELVGRLIEENEHVLVIHGIGEIDVKRLYGVGAVMAEAPLHFVVQLEPREPGKEYERLGIDDRFTKLLGVQVPLLTIPVQPGRNLAVTIEVAAIDQRQRKFGYNAAAALEERMLTGPASDREISGVEAAQLDPDTSAPIPAPTRPRPGKASEPQKRDTRPKR